jgi:intraflagellar transport protein 172
LKKGESADDAKQLLTVDVNSGLAMLAANNQWDECLKQAAKQSVAELNKYVALYAANLIKQGYFPRNHVDFL